MTRRGRTSHGRTRSAPETTLPSEPVVTSTGVVELVRDPEHPSGVTVYINDAESSYLDLADPGHLEFEYMQQMEQILESRTPSPEPRRVVHLGGAGCALARAFAHARPGSRQLVVEIDGELARLARDWFGLPRAPELRIRVADALEAMHSLRQASWDVIVRDVFAGVRVPPHVRTLEAARAASAALDDQGLYLVNLTDWPPLTSARAEAATLREVFPHLFLVADPAILRGRRFGNIVLAASHHPVDTEDVDRRLRRLPHQVRVVAGEDLRTFIGTTAAIEAPRPPRAPEPRPAPQ